MREKIIIFAQLFFLSLFIIYVKKTIIVDFIIQKFRSKRTSLKKYTNQAKLIYFSLILREQKEKKPNISHLSGLTREWKECHFGSTNVTSQTKSLYGMTYYSVVKHSSDQSINQTIYFNDLDVSVYPTNKPRGPSYDNSCAAYKTSSKINTNGQKWSAAIRSSTMEVNIKQYERYVNG